MTVQGHGLARKGADYVGTMEVQDAGVFNRMHDAKTECHDQLWRWNNIVALVLSVLVILGLVVGVRVVRKTEDIASTLIAVVVGALVTLGPLALLQST